MLRRAVFEFRNLRREDIAVYAVSVGALAGTGVSHYYQPTRQSNDPRSPGARRAARKN